MITNRNRFETRSRMTCMFKWKKVNFLNNIMIALPNWSSRILIIHRLLAILLKIINLWKLLERCSSDFSYFKTFANESTSARLSRKWNSIVNFVEPLLIFVVFCYSGISFFFRTNIIHHGTLDLNQYMYVRFYRTEDNDTYWSHFCCSIHCDSDEQHSMFENRTHQQQSSRAKSFVKSSSFVNLKVWNV